jgi:DNA mismatch repair protein MutS2
LVVAERFGLPKETLADAHDYLDHHEEASVSEAIKKLSEVTRETEIEKAKTLDKEKALEQKESQLSAKEAALTKREASIMADVSAKKADILEGYEKQLQRILEQVTHEGVKMHEVISAKKALEDTKPTEKEETFSGPIAVGDYVNIPSAFVAGRVAAIQGQKVEVATREGITYKTILSKLVRVGEPPEEKPVAMTGVQLDDLAKQKSLPLELNLIGEHVEEAMSDLDKYLDTCRLKGFKRVRIIHGWGSGALREAVRDYLGGKSWIDHYESAGEYEGGGGATIVYLK